MSIVNVGELMQDPDFVTPSVTLRRPGVPTVANEGIFTPTYLPDQPIAAIVQPASPADLKSLPEGVHLEDVVAIWSDTQLKIGDDTGAGSDVIVWKGQSYRVRTMDDRADNGYWRVLAERFFP